ncbi:MAG TPA: chemotaxis protein CheW [Oscillospiraceae bacterium]|nr:chemotaxis protein CheW [Oscillospiraceae bacterium]
MTDTELYTEASGDFMATGGKVLLFDIEDNVYGVEIQYITEIIGIQPITIVPKVPDYIKGVINLRGKVIPVMSVRKRFGKEEIPYDERTCIIVIEYDNIAVGLIVDKVNEVLEVDPEQISATPDYKSVNSNRYISAIIETQNGIKLLLNCQKIVAE